MGEAVYWTTTVIAGLMVAWVGWGYWYNIEKGDPVFSIIPLLFAVAIWLAGWVCRKLLARR
jgi:hypothetical protein